MLFSQTRCLLRRGAVCFGSQAATAQASFPKRVLTKTPKLETLLTGVNAVPRALALIDAASAMQHEKDEQDSSHTEIGFTHTNSGHFQVAGATKSKGLALSVLEHAAIPSPIPITRLLDACTLLQEHFSSVILPPPIVLAVAAHRLLPTDHSALKKHTLLSQLRFGASVSQQLNNKTAQTQELLALGFAPSIVAKLLPFQLGGVLAGIKTQGRLLLADEMGLGKTVQAILVAKYFEQDWPLLVVVPSSLKLNWAFELNRWMGMGLDKMEVVDAAATLKLDKKICIISYGLMSNCQDMLLAHKFQMIIFDESHYIKSQTAQRSKAALALAQQAMRVICITGTPSMSRPSELYNQLLAVSPKMFPSFTSFGKRYCDGKLEPIPGSRFQRTRFAWNFDGTSNASELNWLLTETIMVRRQKAAVLPDLPSKVRCAVHVTITDKPRRSMDVAYAELIKQAANHRVAKDPTALIQVRLLCTQLFQLSGLAKLPATIEYVNDLLEGSNDKHLIFAHHREVLNHICTNLDKRKYSHIRIDGSTPVSERQQLCHKFQTDPECRVAVLSMTAAGVGLTLHAATSVIFAELYWNPAQMLQAEDRAHRIGQKSSVIVRYVISPHSFDRHIMRAIERKYRVVGQVVDGVNQHFKMTVLNDEDHAASLPPDIHPEDVDVALESLVSSVLPKSLQ